jgi:hypothetical protein
MGNKKRSNDRSENWTKGEASKRIDELQQKTGRGKSDAMPDI